MLLKPKLFSPQPSSNFVSRPRLLQRLNDGLQAKLILIRAPAGYGKTSLVADWLNQHPVTTGWLSLDAADSDPITFARYFIAAAQQIEPTCCATINTTSAALSHVLPVLINDLFELEADSLLILDDYHLIDHDDIHQAIAYLLDHMPPRLHLLLITRSVPPIKLLSRLRARGQLVEIDAADLRFTNNETAEFLNNRELLLTSEQIAILETHTEGWISGLQLVANSIEGYHDTNNFLKLLNQSTDYLVDYLAQETLSQSSSEIQNFLLETCILDYLSPPLCDAVRAKQDSREQIDELERRNLFLISLDNDHHWYRYHHIFRDVLNEQSAAQLTAKQRAELHRRAAVWFVAEGEVRMAIDHFLNGHAYNDAAEQIVTLMPQIVAGGEALVLRAWLDQLPPRVFTAMPTLLSMRALIDVRAGRWRSAQRDLNRLQEISELHSSDLAFASLISSEIATLQDDIPTAIKLAESALEQFEPSNMKLHTAGRLMNLYFLAGNWVAMRRLQAKIKPTIAPTLESELNQLLVQGETAFAVGLLHDATDLYRQGLRKARLANMMMLPIVGAFQIGLARVRLEWGELDAAESLLMKGLNTLKGTLFHNQLISGLLCLHNVKRLQGDMEEAAKQLAQASTLLHSFHVSQASALMDAYVAQFALYQGDTQKAVQWVRACGLAVEGEDVGRHMSEYLVLAHVLAARGEIPQALSILQQIESHSREAQQRLLLVQSLVAQAILQAYVGDNVAAIDVMKQAVKAAEPENITRPFLEKAEPTGLLLQQIRPQKLGGFLPDFVDDLLTALGMDAVETAHINTEPQAATLSADVNEIMPLLDPLTEREIAVLGHLAQGLSNQEIADAMFVTVSTTRTHLRNLYSKLNARSRTHAIVRAQGLNLIDK